MISNGVYIGRDKSGKVVRTKENIDPLLNPPQKTLMGLLLFLAITALAAPPPRLSLLEGIIRPPKTRMQLERNFLENKQSMGFMGNKNSSKLLPWFLRFAEVVLFTVGV